MNRRERYAMARQVCQKAGGLKEGAARAYAERSARVERCGRLSLLVDGEAQRWHACWTTILDCIQALDEFRERTEAARKRRQEGLDR